MDARLLAHQSAYRYPKRDNSPIYEWARKHIHLPSSYAINGAFDVRTSPWLIPVFDALQNEGIRRVHLRKGIQVGGTLVADIWIPWLIVNDPGPISWTMHTDDMIQLHAKMRLNPVLEACKPVAALLPRNGPLRTITEIHFGGFSLILNAANISDQQGQSIKYKVNDETWHPKWQSVYADAIGRVSAYENVGTSKALDISQGGIEGDVEDRSYRAGDQGEWSAECPSCCKVHRVGFALKESDEAEAKQLGGVVWDGAAKGEDDLWDIARAVETTRFRCPHCGHESDDSDQTRERWKDSGRYAAKNPRGAASRKSFHIESIVSRPMKLLTEEWLNACNEATRTGNEEPMQKFRQKREARPWKVEKTAVNIINIESEHTVEQYANGERVPGEIMRAMTIDPQLTHFWVEVGAWGGAPEYTQLFFGRVDTIDAARLLQLKYGVPDTCVGMDRNYKPSETDGYCARYAPPGRPDLGWRGLAGQTRKTWVMENDQTKQMDVFPHSDPKWSALGGGVSVPFYEFSGDHMKDILFNCLNGKGFKWNLPSNINPLYLEHLKSEAKQETRPGVWRWVEIRQNANHGIDTSAMMLTIAVVAGIVRFRLTDEK